MVGFDGHEVSDELAGFVREGLPAGVILFARNIASTEQVASLLRELRLLWPQDGPSPLFAVDQEGGRVRRLKAPATPEFSPWPPMRQVGDTADRHLAESIGRVMGAQLAALGFNLNFAPVLDVDSNPQNPVIGQRSFGADPEFTAEMALSVAAGLESEGILTCGKHFPGHGDTDSDSHHTLPRLSHRRDRLERVELVPFRKAVERRAVSCFMTAHIVFEELDSDVPATLSPVVLPTLLRQELGFDGVVVTDDLEMAAIAEHYDPAAIARGGDAADVDLFLVCHRLGYARQIRDEIATWTPSRLQRSCDRLDALRGRARDHASRPWTGELPLRELGRQISLGQGW